MSDSSPVSGLTNALKNSVSSPDTLRWVDRAASGMYVVPAGHRLRTLAFSLGFSLVGNGLRHVLEGVYADGTERKKKDTVFFLRPLHGLLKHNKHSDDPEDRWKAVIGHSLPVIGAGIGAYLGSYNWAATSPAGSANLEVAEDVAAKLKAGNKDITLAEASIYTDAERGHTSRIMGGLLQGLGLHSGVHQLFVPWMINLGITLGGAFLGANNRTLNAYGTDGLAKSSKEMADHLGRNTYNRVLAETISELAKKNPVEAENFVAEMLASKIAANPDMRDKLIAQGLKDIQTNGAVNLVEEYANKVLHRYFARAAVDYRKSLGDISTGLRQSQDAVVKDWVAKLVKENGSPQALQQKIEEAGQSIVTQALGNYDAKKKIFEQNNLLQTIRGAGFDETKVEVGERNWVYRTLEYLNPFAKSKASKQLQDSFKKNVGAGGLAAVSVPEVGGISPGLGTALLGTTALASVTTMVAAKPKETPDLFAGYREREQQRGFKGFLNTKVLPKVEFLNRMSIADPSWGRFWLAGGFTLGLMATDYLLQVPFGRSISSANGNALLSRIEPVPMPASWRNAWAYDPLGGTTRDRWLKNAQTFAVMAGGALGTYLGAKFATRDRRAKMQKEGTYLDDYEDRVTFAQGKAWEIPTAIASTPGSALGTTHLGMIPGINYGANIANYHLLSSGGKIAWEGPGKTLMGSRSHYRFGPVKLLDHMIQYAAYNPDEYPKQLIEMANGIVLPWFPDAKPEHINAFVGEVLKVRNEHWQQGGIPVEKKEAVIKELTQHFRAAGLEKTLIGIGLNPAEAVLGNNGLIGKVSNFFGASDETKKLKIEFLQKFETRHPEQVQERRDRVASHQKFDPATTADLAAQALAANDRNGGSFASRTAPRVSAQALLSARSGQSALERAEASRQGVVHAL